MITSIGVQGQPSPKKTIYQFKVTNLEGEEFDFSTLKGKKVMIVNTASKCGITRKKFYCILKIVLVINCSAKKLIFI